MQSFPTADLSFRVHAMDNYCDPGKGYLSLGGAIQSGPPHQQASIFQEPVVVVAQKANFAENGGPEKELVIRLCSTAPLASPRLRRPGPHFTVSRHEGGASSLGFPTRLSQSRRVSAAAATSPPHRNARPIEAWTACCIAAFLKGKYGYWSLFEGEPDLLAHLPIASLDSSDWTRAGRRSVEIYRVTAPR